MVYCGQCGGKVYEEDRFCGNCGADVPRDVSQNVFDEPDNGRSVEDSQQPMPEPSNTSRGPDQSRGRVPVLLLSSVAVLVVLLGAGVFAFIRLDPLGSMVGEVAPPAAGEQAGTSEGAVPLSTVEEETYSESTKIGSESTYGDTVAGPSEDTIDDERDPVGSSDGPVAAEEAVDEAVYSHYNAIGDTGL